MSDPVQADELPTVARLGDGFALGLYRDGALVATCQIERDEMERHTRRCAALLGLRLAED